MSCAPPPFLEAAPFNVRAEFGRRAGLVRVPEGRQVLMPGQACTGMAFVVEGRVRVYLLSSEGREVTLYRVQDGHGCVLTAACILGGTPFPASAVAEQTVQAHAVSAVDFRDWVTRHAFWREYIFRLIGERLASVLARLDDAMFQRFDTRLARLLLPLAGPAGEIRLTQEQIARELGSAREVVSRTLNRWRTEGMVRLGRGLIQVESRSALERLGAAT
jgi:CRP/FNR family transcriptional regulator, anaerobic regulatory protein